jgi:hypothetical protein
MINPHMINYRKDRGGTGEHDNAAIQTQLKDPGQCKATEQHEHTVPSGQHPQHQQHELMNAAPTTDNFDIPDHERNQGSQQKKETMRSTSNQEYKKKIIFKKSIITCNISNFKCNMFIDSRFHTQARENEIKYRLKVEDKGRRKENGSSTNQIKLQKLTIPPCVEVTTFHFMWKQDYSTSCGNYMSTLRGQNLFYPPCVGRNFCFIKKINITKFLTTNQKQIRTQNYKVNSTTCSIVTNLRHLRNNIKANLQNDIEANPGPGEKLQIITLNCRGLGDINKFRLLLNKAYNIMQKGKMIMLIQETMITNSRYLDLAWRGKYMFTPGTGSSQGCITLIHNDVTVTDIEHIENRGHYFKFIDSDNKQTLVVNIYAPLCYNNEKREFLNNIINIVQNYDGENIVLGGDFKITLNEVDSYRRQRTDAEKRIADDFNTKINESNLVDTWAGHTGYTWMQGKKQSRLDRIYIRLANHSVKKLETNWTLIKSDHAAVILTLEHIDKTSTKNEHVKLDNMIVTNTELLNELKKYLEEQMTQATHMDPHTKLELQK